MRVKEMILKVSHPAFQAAVDLLRNDPSRVAVCRKPWVSDGLIICQDFRVERLGGSRRNSAPRVELCLAPKWMVEAGVVGMQTFIKIGYKPNSKMIVEVLLEESLNQPLSAIRIIGHSIREITVHPSSHFLTSDDVKRYSRTIGALGEKRWMKLISSKYLIVGVGRTGSCIASSLARMGARNLTLVDPDIVEPHNLDGMDGAFLRDVGQLKVDVVANSLRSINKDIQVKPIPESIIKTKLLTQVKDIDFMIVCTDNNESRLVSSIVSNWYFSASFRYRYRHCTQGFSTLWS